MRIFKAVEVMSAEGQALWLVVDDHFRLGEELRGYALWLAHSGRAVNTQKAYQLRLARFLSWCAETQVAWNSLRFHQLVGYKAFLESQAPGGDRLSGRTVNAHLTAVLTFLRYAVAHGFATDTLRCTVEQRMAGAVPLRAAEHSRYPRAGRLLKAREVSRRPAVFSRQQVDGVLETLERPRDRLLVLLMLRCGLRAGEVLGLALADLHMLPDSGSLGCLDPGPHVHVVRRMNSNGAWAKSPHSRSIPLPADVCEVHGAYMALRYRALGQAQPSALFLALSSEHPAPLGYPGLHSMLKAVGERTGIPVRAHQFRHTAATGWARSGVAPDVIMALMGHRSLASTSIYLHPATEDLRGAVEGSLPARETS